MIAISPTLFYLRSTVRFAIRLLGRRILQPKYRRTPEVVLDEYEGPRQRFLEAFRASSWPVDEYVMRECDDDQDAGVAYFIDGKIRYGCGREVRRELLERLEHAVRQYDAASVLEVGSGTGYNLIYLRSRIPGLKITGIELTAAGTAAATLAAERYGYEADFRCMNAADDWSDLPMADVVYSVHALEMMPELSRGVLEQMERHARKAVVLFEPLPDGWSGGFELPSRLRARHLDRLRPGAVEGFDVVEQRLLSSGTALNRTVEIHLRPRSTARGGETTSQSGG